MTPDMLHGWFGPKKVGWGANPRKWQGWLATVLYVLAAIGIQTALADDEQTIWIAQGGLLLAFLGLVYLTYDKTA